MLGPRVAESDMTERLSMHCCSEMILYPHLDFRMKVDLKTPGSKVCPPLGCCYLCCMCGIWLQRASICLTPVISQKRGRPRFQGSCRVCRDGAYGQATQDGCSLALYTSLLDQALFLSSDYPVLLIIGLISNCPHACSLPQLLVSLVTEPT